MFKQNQMGFPNNAYLGESLQAGVKSLSKMPVKDRGKDVGHCLFIEGFYANQVEVPQEAVCELSSSSTRGPHGGKHDNVLQVHGALVISVKAYKSGCTIVFFSVGSTIADSPMCCSHFVECDFNFHS